MAIRDWIAADRLAMADDRVSGDRELLTVTSSSGNTVFQDKSRLISGPIFLKY